MIIGSPMTDALFLPLLDTDEAAVNTLRNLLVEEDRLLRYLDPPEGGDYTPFIQK